MIELAERLADVEVTDEDRRLAVATANWDVGPAAGVVACATYKDASPSNARRAIIAVLETDRGLAPALIATLRCLIAHPDRAVSFDPRWRMADTVGLARGIYVDRVFDRLPLLADALMDAGCADE